MHVLSYLFFMFAGYLSGSILYSYLIPRWFCHLDITKLSDDGNPGAANAVKCAGWRVGLVCVVLDLLKGFFPIFIALYHLDFTSWWFTPVISAPVFGHAFSPFWKGKGGKAIAVSFGVLLGLLPWYHVVFALATLYIFLSIGVVINPHRLRSIATYTLFAIYCVYAYWLQGRLETSIFCGCLLVCLIVVGKHLRPEEKEKFQIEILPALFDPKKSGTADR